MDGKKADEQKLTRFVNDWIDEVEGLRNTIRAALACPTEEEMRATLIKMINSGE